MRVHANCSSVAPLAGSKRSIEAIKASRPQEMKSSTSQRAGSSRTFLKTMYLTSGAYVRTSRLRASTSPVALYARQRASASSEEIFFLVSVAGITGAIGTWGADQHHRFVVIRAG